MPDQVGGQLGDERHEGDRRAAEIQAAVQVDAAYTAAGDAGSGPERGKPLRQVVPQPRGRSAPQQAKSRR
nr:hypothetical protein [Streptomyces incarnatus]